MKKNTLISAIAGWKSAALLALIAMVASIAFSGVLSTTPTAEAQQASTAAKVDGSPGGTVDLVFKNVAGAQDGSDDGGDTELTATGATAFTYWRIQTTGKERATFASGGGLTLTCKNGTATAKTACDKDNTDGIVKVTVNIPANSGEGIMLVYARLLTKTDAAARVYPIEVKAGLQVTSLKLTPSATAASATDGEVTFTLEAKGSDGTNLNTGDTKFSMTTTAGLFIEGCESSNTQVCANTLSSGSRNDIKLKTGGAAGAATVTAKLGALTATAKITFYGPKVNITAVPDNSAIQIGDKTFVVVTVTDALGQPFPGHTVAAADVTVAGPTTSAVKVTTKTNVPKEVGTADGKIAATGELPHCDSTTPNTPAAVTDPATYAAGGTNAMGKCVIEVTAPKGATADKNATRGAHVVSVKLTPATGAAKTAMATINVRGAPSSITTDAPESVEALSTTTVTVSVLDDTGELVGTVPLQVDLIAGEGKVTTTPTMTTNGTAKFVYVASLSGEAIFRVAAGTGADMPRISVRINIGAMDDMDDDDDAMMEKTWNKTPTAAEPMLVWLGEDGADPSKGAVTGVVAIWKPTGDGWVGYFPDAADAGVPMGTALTELKHNEAYWVVVR